MPILEEQAPSPGPAAINLEEEIEVEVEEEKREDVEESRDELFKEKEETGVYNMQKIRDAVLRSAFSILNDSRSR